MNLPKVISDLLTAQQNYDSDAYADCFSETAIVFDEGNTYQGRDEIKKWIEEANQQYKITMEAVEYVENGSSAMLTAKISGTFEGSPVLLDYHLEITSALISRFEITISAIR